jgi:hypothetical protein
MTFCSLDSMDRFGLFDFQRLYVNYFGVFLTFDYYWFHLFPAGTTDCPSYLRFNCRMSRDRYDRPVQNTKFAGHGTCSVKEQVGNMPGERRNLLFADADCLISEP